MKDSTRRALAAIAKLDREDAARRKPPIARVEIVVRVELSVTVRPAPAATEAHVSIGGDRNGTS